MENIIKKFMNELGITYDIHHSKKKFNWIRGHWYVCTSVLAYHKGDTEMEMHFCYKKTQSGEISFEDANIVKEPKEGIFAYLGLNREVYDYFKGMTRKIAEDILSED